MKLKIRRLFAWILILSMAATMPAFCGHTDIKSENPWRKLTTYNELITVLQNIDRTDPNISCVTIATTGEENLPVVLVTVSGQRSRGQKLNVLILARVHGNEPAGMEACLDFIKNIYRAGRGERKKYIDNFNLFIIPCMNPEGAKKAAKHYRISGGFWDRTGRKNGRNIDINRDYLCLRCSETRAAVNVFNREQIHAVIDLHEYSSLPLIVGRDGWWRAKYFDFMIGVGRNPDVYPPLADFAVETTEKKIFPYTKQHQYRGQYYATSSGNFDSSFYHGANAADYFNLRNATTFLVETAGYDQGESTLGKRTRIHLLILDKILNHLLVNRDRVIALTSESKKFSRSRRKLTLSMKTKDVKIKLNGRKVSTFDSRTGVSINGRIFYSNPNANFRRGDPKKRKFVELPDFYRVMTLDTDIIKTLLGHGIKVYYNETGEVVAGQRIPAGCFIIPTGQTRSAIIGNILDNRIYKKNRYAPDFRCLVIPGSGFEQFKSIKAVENTKQVNRIIKIFTKNIGLYEDMEIIEKPESLKIPMENDNDEDYSPDVEGDLDQ